MVGSTVADLLETAMAQWPDATAVVAGDEALSYAELEARTTRLAHHLHGLGVGSDSMVGVLLERSVDMAVALVAVLRAGGACVPLDPTYPDERLAFMVADAGVAAVVTRTALAGRLPPLPPAQGAARALPPAQGAARAASHVPVVRLDDDDAAWASPVTPLRGPLGPSSPPPRSIGPENLGYLIYTSGSTGRPKGVMLTHRGLVNHHRAAASLYELGPGDRVLQFSSIGFDASIEEMFPPWTSGATVVFRPDDAPLLGRGWLAWVREQRITVLSLPTAYWHEWIRDLEALGEPVPDDIRIVVVGGEKALGPAYRNWARISGGRSRWVNVYGPTETTCMSTFYEPRPGGADVGDERDPPIGRPLPNTTVGVVDDRLEPVAPGATGELLIGGAGLARGYLNRPELTAERFVRDVAGEPGRMYRTGDLVRQLPDGDLDFVGRIDNQVKIRGFRIECGEVEAALVRHPEVAAAAVVAHDEPPADQQLVAYVVAAAGATVTTGDLRRFLADHLPAHMVPGAFVVLDALPLTPNKKVDRTALPPPQPAEAATDAAGVGPRSATEERVAAIWARVLGLDPATVGTDDDFFDLGGHSLLATQVIAQLREEFGTETPLRAIFEAPTVAGLAALVQPEGTEAETTGLTEAPALTPRPAQAGPALPLSLAQEQMWVLERSANPPGLYNITALHRFERPVDEDAIRHALRYMIGRHETLRTRFPSDTGRPQQIVLPSVDVELGVSDLGDVPEAEREHELRCRIVEKDAQPFDLDRAPLFRAHLFHLDDATSRLAVTFDHLICDGTATSIFVTELVAAYEAITAGREPDLPPLDVQFADFCVWQRSHVTDDVLRRQLDWWAGALKDVPSGPAVAFDRFPETLTRRITSCTFTVGPDIRRRLDDVARTTGSTVFVVAAAAVQALFARYSGITDIVMSTTLSGRNRAELEGLVGMFSGIGRIRNDLSGDPPFTEVVARGRERVLGMFDNQDIPFMRVRQALLPAFPGGGRELAAALPVEFSYFHTSHETWDPANAGGQRARGDTHDQELFFRGQLHPLSVTLLDDGTEISGELSYKLDFYEPETIAGLAGDLVAILDAVGRDPARRVSELGVTARSAAGHLGLGVGPASE
ncbi:MAG: amino acid adenylation domain-containing protein [Acidimicrobiales bacterium]